MQMDFPYPPEPDWEGDWLRDPSSSDTGVSLGTDQIVIRPEECEYDESVVEMLGGLPRTFADLPYTEDDDL